jgi:sterol desaturase/sphingolipid hydroxylase (fatty acid hydroxylase superfamily)
MDSFIREHSVLLAFWGAIILLGTIEFLAPQFPDNADRGHRWFANFGLGILNGLIVSVVPAVTVATALWASRAHYGALNLIAAPWWAALLVTVLVRSLAQYGFHVLCHKVPLLWRLHRVHHSDLHLDVSSSFRNHPLEMIANLAYLSAVIAICGLSPVVLGGYEAVELFANMLTHANLKIPDRIERLMRPMFVTPGLHRLHHSPIRVETDSNYGNVFSIWDRVFGTLRRETMQSGAALRFGLDEVDSERARDLHAQLMLPWSRLSG